MKLDKYGRFVDVWDWLLNLLLPVKDVDLIVERLSDGRFDMTLKRGGKEGKHTGFGYDATYAIALADLEKNEGC